MYRHYFFVSRLRVISLFFVLFFFFNDPATTEIYTLSLHDALPIFSGAMAKAGKGLLEGTLQAGTSAVSDKLLDLVGLGGKSAADKGKDTRDYLADRKSGSAGMPRPISYAVFCLKKKNKQHNN